MLGEFTGENESDGGLNFAGGEGLCAAVGGELGSLGGDALEEVVDEGVHDAHSLGGNTGIGVNLLEDFVDVDGIGFGPLFAPLLLLGGGRGRNALLALVGLGDGLVTLGSHFDVARFA